eukprot:JP446323.1.p1 GENE.JP446323.1~~JP446323.1.p1  ORF type:complete len:179 (+),score=26.29 JP446323.1:119-655(+)
MSSIFSKIRANNSSTRTIAVSALVVGSLAYYVYKKKTQPQMCTLPRMTGETRRSNHKLIIHDEIADHSVAFFHNKKGLALFTQKWFPKGTRDVKAIICLCHGYGDHTSNKMHVVEYFLEAGFGVAAIDYEGHGRSDGLHVYFDSFDDIAEDCMQYFDSVCAEFPNKKRFLYGESMGEQ